MTNQHHLRFASAVVALALVTAGCGSSNPSGSGTTAASDAAATAQKAATASGGSPGGGKTIDLCNLMPVATVAQLSGQPVTVAKADNTVASSGIYNCNYTSADGVTDLSQIGQVGITVHTSSGKLDYDSGLEAVRSVNVGAAKPNDISGLGDKAYSSIDGVHALFGNVEIEVSGLSLATAAAGLNSGDPVAGAKALINAVHAKL
jgi:hypothetical protein